MNLRWQYGTFWFFQARRCRWTGRVDFFYDGWKAKYGVAYWVKANRDLLPIFPFRPYHGLRWIRRLGQWLGVVLVEARDNALPWPNPLKMLRAIRTGGVDRATWRRRLRTCRQCPVYDGELRRCRGPKIGPRHGDDAKTRWNDEGGIHWLEIETDRGWLKFAYFGDNISTGETPAEIAARTAPFEKRIADDWAKVAPGCGCYVPFLALTRAPYTGAGGTGCWGRAQRGNGFGWQ
jgi:hypothetical protein